MKQGAAFCESPRLSRSGHNVKWQIINVGILEMLRLLVVVPTMTFDVTMVPPPQPTTSGAASPMLR